jgi:hypothetical protein
VRDIAHTFRQRRTLRLATPTRQNLARIMASLKSKIFEERQVALARI